MKNIPLLLWLMVAHLGAQPSFPTAVTPAPVPVEKGEVDVSFTMVGWGEEFAGLTFKQGGEFRSLGIIPLFKKGVRQRFTGPNQLLIFKGSPTADSKSVPLVSVPLPLGSKRLMILLLPKKGGSGYEAIPVKDDFNSIPLGQAMVMNLTTCPLGITVDEEKPFSLPVEGTELIASKQGTSFQFEVHYSHQKQWKRSHDCILSVKPTSQTLVFLLQSDSPYFKDVDGNTHSPIQMVLMNGGNEEEERK